MDIRLIQTCTQHSDSYLTEGDIKISLQTRLRVHLSEQIPRVLLDRVTACPLETRSRHVRESLVNIVGAIWGDTLCVKGHFTLDSHSTMPFLACRQ